MNNIYKLDREQIKNNNNLIKLLTLIDPISVILYGSYSINKQTDNSDIDLLIIFKKNIHTRYPDIDNKIKNLKRDIIKLFNKKVDIVFMINANKIQYKYNFHQYVDNDTDFIFNIYEDAYVIYGKKDKDIILESIKYKKY